LAGTGPRAMATATAVAKIPRFMIPSPNLMRIRSEAPRPAFLGKTAKGAGQHQSLGAERRQV
jgi:hypothetical protein